MRFLLADYTSMMRERRVWLAAALLASSVLLVPQLLAKPPPHVVTAVTAWFGTNDPFALFMYVWTDLAMNKTVAVVAVVIAGGVMVRERDLQILPVLLSKPLSAARYFTTRTVSACAVMATLFLATHIVGAPLLSRQVVGFQYGHFFASMCLHVWAAIFATALSATLAVVIRNRALSSVISLLLLMVLVGAAFLGFYNPAWHDAALINPFALGIEAVGNLADLKPLHVIRPMVALMAMTAMVVAAGARQARRIEA